MRLAPVFCTPSTHSSNARSRYRSPVGGGRCGCVNEDVVLGQLSDVLLNSLHLFLEVDLSRFLPEGIKLGVVGLFLVLNVENLPLFLKSSDQLTTLFLRHEELSSVLLSLLFDLHLTNKVVLVLNLVLDVGEVFRGLAVGLLLKEVFVLVSGQFGCY